MELLSRNRAVCGGSYWASGSWIRLLNCSAETARVCGGSYWASSWIPTGRDAEDWDAVETAFRGPSYVVARIVLAQQ
jgi:hypothetical protein